MRRCGVQGRDDTESVRRARALQTTGATLMRHAYYFEPSTPPRDTKNGELGSSALGPEPGCRRAGARSGDARY
eukprot:4588423-Prymnesium_polylepis.1